MAGAGKVPLDSSSGEVNASRRTAPPPLVKPLGPHSYPCVACEQWGGLGCLQPPGSSRLLDQALLVQLLSRTTLVQLLSSHLLPGAPNLPHPAPLSSTYM